jgi:hypothetical protein
MTTDSNVWGGASGHTYTFTRQPNGTTDIDVVVVSDGKNLKGVLGFVLGTIGLLLLLRWRRPVSDCCACRRIRERIGQELGDNLRHLPVCPSSIHDAVKLGQPELSRLCLPQAISQCDHSVADALPFAQIEALRMLKTHIGEKPASFANKLYV